MNLMHSKPVILAAVLAAAPLPFWGAQNDSQKDCKRKDALPSDDFVAARITNTELRRVSNLHDYSVVRTYSLRNTHLKQDAVMTVRMSYSKGQGKSFEIVALKNAEGMSRKVLERLIQTEAETSRKPSHDELNVGKENYKFHVTGTGVLNGRRCYIVELTPKRRSKYLIQGKAWVDTNEFALVRVEGRPAASLSFWVGKPYIVQDFDKVGSFWMASHNRSESQSFLLGSSVLTIDYSQYQVNPETQVAQTVVSSPKAAPLE